MDTVTTSNPFEYHGWIIRQTKGFTVDGALIDYFEFQHDGRWVGKVYNINRFTNGSLLKTLAFIA